MKYPIDTYRKYPVFCQTVAGEAKTRVDKAHFLGKILTIISVLVGHPAVFSVVAVMAGGSALLYYGSIGAVFAANPYLGAVLVGTFGFGMGRVIFTVYKERAVLQKFKECVVDRYEGDFLVAPDTASADVLHVTDARAAHVEGLVERAVADFLNSLVHLGHISPTELQNALDASGMLRG